MWWPRWRSLVFLSLLVLWSTAGSSPTACAAAVMPVRVGVVLDLSSDVGRKSGACISKALHDFDLKHPSYATLVELRVSDSRADLATAVHAGRRVRLFRLRTLALTEAAYEPKLSGSNAGGFAGHGAGGGRVRSKARCGQPSQSSGSKARQSSGAASMASELELGRRIGRAEVSDDS